MNGANLHILATEDDPVMQCLLRDLLMEEGYHVSLTPAADIAEVKRLDPDVILLDYRVGANDSGWRFLEGLKGDPETEGIPVVFLTADHQAMAGRAGALAALGVGAVLKPFDVEELIAAIEGAMAGVAARVAAG